MAGSVSGALSKSSRLFLISASSISKRLASPNASPALSGVPVWAWRLREAISFVSWSI